MTVEEIRDWIETIKKKASDDEVAHAMEDELHQEVLQAISEGAPNAAELAFEALKTCDIAFARWCA